MRLSILYLVIFVFLFNSPPSFSLEGQNSVSNKCATIFHYLSSKETITKKITNSVRSIDNCYC